MPDTSQFNELLNAHGLKKTRARLQVLDVLSRSKTAISQPFLEKEIGDGVDRVTLYRVLKAFEDEGIIHKVINNEGTANYAMQLPQAGNDIPAEHVHFNCTSCNKVFCLKDLPIPHITLSMPRGFKAATQHFTIYGTCAQCNTVA